MSELDIDDILLPPSKKEYNKVRENTGKKAWARTILFGGQLKNGRLSRRRKKAKRVK
jgi:hypothetical protein